MKNKKICETLKQAQQAVEQANQAINSVMQELNLDDLEIVAGGGNPFGDVPRPDPNPLDPNPRGNG